MREVYTDFNFNGLAQFSGQVRFISDITPTQITTDVNDYDPAGNSSATTFRLSTDASRNITGLASGYDGRIVIFQNVGSFDIILKNSSVNSLNANRFLLPSDTTISSNQSLILQYDSTVSKWRSISSASSGGGSGSSTPATVNIVNFSGDGTTTTFNTGVTLPDENLTNVYISGVYQQKSDYSISGSNIVFSTAPPAGTNNIEVAYFSINIINAQKVFIQTTQPIVSGPYLWIDTTGGNLNFWIENGS